MTLCGAPDQDHALGHDCDGAAPVQGHVHVPLLAHVLGTSHDDALVPGQGWELERYAALLQDPAQLLELGLAQILAVAS